MMWDCNWFASISFGYVNLSCKVLQSSCVLFWDCWIQVLEICRGLVIAMPIGYCLRTRIINNPYVMPSKHEMFILKKKKNPPKKLAFAPFPSALGRWHLVLNFLHWDCEAWGKLKKSKHHPDCLLLFSPLKKNIKCVKIFFPPPRPSVTNTTFSHSL